MAINPSAIASQSIKEQLPFALELLVSRPDLVNPFTPTRPAGQLVGWYNASTDSVELYIVNRAGNRFIKVS